MTAVPLRRNRDFLLLQAGQLLSGVGTQSGLIAYPLLVLALTGSAAKAGLVAFARALSSTVLALPAGVVADRWDRRRLMIAADVIRGILILGLMLVRGPEQVWLAYVVLGITVSMTAFF
ncbi:MAG TPA: MFS transporter, partial [Actinomycetes bacterium]|nr:MFS transporter [Actinomycetes bacterium]